MDAAVRLEDQQTGVSDEILPAIDEEEIVGQDGITLA